MSRLESNFDTVAYVGGRTKVVNFTTGTSSSDTVTTQIGATATVNTPISTLTAAGVYVGTVADKNDSLRVLIRLTGTDTAVYDGIGGAVYGKLTHPSGYTLSYFKTDGSAYTFGSATAIDFKYVEVFNLNAMPINILLNGFGAVVDMM